jgi:uncharacterized membrane protein YqaE (UPF0057 family)/tetrahydromethanopterin S-methyltransferase subunit G
MIQNINITNNKKNIKNNKFTIKILFEKSDIQLSNEQINDLTLNELYQFIGKQINKDINSFYLLGNNKVIPLHNLLKYSKIIDLFKVIYPSEEIISLRINFRLNGGIGGMGNIGDKIKDTVTGIFEPVAEPFVAIGDFFITIFRGILFLFKITVWFIQFAIWFTVEFLNPVYLFTDLIGSVYKITRLCIYGIIDIIFGFLRYSINNIFGPIMDGNIMGWDQETYKKEKEEKLKKEAMIKKRKENLESKFTNTEQNLDTKGGESKDNFSDNSKNSKDKRCGDDDKCYKTPPGQLPFSIIIMTIICPPVGIFMQFGLSFWINILVCALLTLVFYFPGLLYALILLYC